MDDSDASGELGSHEQPGLTMSWACDGRPSLNEACGVEAAPTCEAVLDNDTLREVPHPSNEGLALQARVSGPWPHKKESVLLVKLARWQGAQVQTVKRQNVVQRYLK